MAVMPQEVQALFNEVGSVAFATAGDGQPNACVVAVKKIIDDETIYLSDQFFKKTLANLQQNPRVSVLFWGKDGAYQIHGTARYVSEGEEFESQKGWVDAFFAAANLPIATKGGCYISVDAVYQVQGGPTAGDQIA